MTTTSPRRAPTSAAIPSSAEPARGALYQISEVARLLGRSDWVVYSYVAKGLLGHVRIGGRVYVTPQQVTEFIEAHTVAPRSSGASSGRKGRA